MIKRELLVPALIPDGALFITRLIEQGADIKAVSRLAGYANMVTTAIYVEDNQYGYHSYLCRR
jgi:hypothetical protein